MSDSFDEEEFGLEEDWVEISDIEGRKASLRHLATVRVDDKTYFVLGGEREGDSGKKALMLLREDKTVDGVNQYVIAGDEHEIEKVVAHFVIHTIKRHLEEEMIGFNEDDETESCGFCHLPGEFCYCDDPAYLQ